MSSLPWSPALEIGLPAMDETHREFVDLLAQAQASDNQALPAAWQAVIEHTEAHFAQEDAWMAATRFAASNCHTLQHRTILQVLREGAERAAQGDITPIRLTSRELAMWFPQHAQTMDAALASHLKRVGFDPTTGQISAAHALPEHEIHGCGGACA